MRDGDGRSSRPRVPRRTAGALLALLVAGMALAAACKSGSSSPTATPAPVTPTALSSEARTAVAALGDDGTVDYKDPQGRYTLQAPRGWDVEETFNTETFSLPGDPINATITILCTPGLTVDEAITSDAQLISNTNTGTLPVNDAVPTVVAGITAKEIKWTGKLGTIPLPHDTVYFEGGGCAWRAQLTTLGGLEIGTLESLFDRVLESFHLVAPGG